MRRDEGYTQEDVETLALMQLVGMSLLDMTVSDDIFGDEFTDERQILRLAATLVLYIKRRIAKCTGVPDNEIDSMAATLEHSGFPDHSKESDGD